MRIVLMLAHSVEEFEQLGLLSELGHDVFSIGGYINPAHPHDDKRPALLNVKHFPELQAIVDGLGTDDNLDEAKRHLPDGIIDWADVIICHHREHTWIAGQWDRIKHKRVVWRTVGQSVENNERTMAPFRAQGLQIVRYSPKEWNIPSFCGADALIRFYKDPEEWSGWTGHIPRVVNFTQHLKQRHPYTNYEFWDEATKELSRLPCGPGSEEHGGIGSTSLEDMKLVLRNSRAYLYTGTQPASYTLGLIEALMTGIPVVSIGPAYMKVFPYGPFLFEGHELSPHWSNSAFRANGVLRDILNYDEFASSISITQRAKAIEIFGKEKVKADWKAFLGE